MQNYTKQTRLRLEAELYKGGVNVALEQAERTKVFKKFLSDLENGLNAPIQAITEDDIQNLLLFVKKNNPLLTQISTLIASRSIRNYIDLEAFLVWSGEQGGQATLDKLLIDATFSLVNHELLEFFRNEANLIINSVDEYTKVWIAEKLEQGKAQNLTVSELAQVLHDEGDGISKVRALRIANTEMANAMISIELRTALENGIKEIIWRTSLDEKVCEICIPLEGIQTDITRGFDTAVGNKKGPPAHVNDRCYLEEVIPEEWNRDKIWTGG